MQVEDNLLVLNEVLLLLAQQFSYHLLVPEEDLRLAQEEDLLLAHEEDLTPVQAEDLRLVQEEHLLLWRLFKTLTALLPLTASLPSNRLTATTGPNSF